MGDLTAFTELIDLVGTTTFRGDNPMTLGFLLDLPSAPLRVNGDLNFFFFNGVPTYQANTGVLRNESVEFPSVGHWLVRSVPESTGGLTSGIAFGLGMLLWKRSKRGSF